jgi:hypothetical protein
MHGRTIVTPVALLWAARACGVLALLGLLAAWWYWPLLLAALGFSLLALGGAGRWLTRCLPGPQDAPPPL